MRTIRYLFVLLAAATIVASHAVKAQQAGDSRLAGSVSSAQEPRMEGVLVSAKAVGSTMTVTVVTNDQGQYAFPARILPPGSYRLSIRAAGYDLADPGPVDVTAQNPVTLNLTLRQTQQLNRQLMNAEWLASFPGTEQQKRGVECLGCHNLSVITHSQHDATGFLGVLRKMRGYNSNSLINFPVRGIPTGLREGGEEGYLPTMERDGDLVKYLASINLSSGRSGKWNYELKTFPRLTGRSTRVVFTEYDLPRSTSQPHDLAIDPNGVPWYPDTSRSFLARIDPNTGVVKEWAYPEMRSDSPGGATDIKFDKKGNVWIGHVSQPGLSKFDIKTETFRPYRIPAEHENSRVMAGQLAISPDDRVVWGRDYFNDKVYKVDVDTGHVTTYPTPGKFYGIETDSNGDVFLMGLTSGVIGKLDARTGQVTTYTPPTKDAGPRRGDVDSKGRYWFGEYNANKIGMFDPRTLEFREWAIQGPFSRPYDVVVDKNGEVWTGGMHTDYIYRLNPATGDVTRYLMPTLNANIRRIDVDNSTTPVSVWIGAAQRAKAVRIQPLD